MKRQKIKPAGHTMPEGLPIDMVKAFFNQEALKEGIIMRVALPYGLVLTKGEGAMWDWFQPYSSCIEGGMHEKVMPRALNDWGKTISVCGAGLYSLIHSQKAGILGRFDVLLRNPEYEEIERDIKLLGSEQLFILSKQEAEQKGIDGPFFKVAGEDMLYAGPSRIDTYYFTTRAFVGGFPPNIQDIKQEIDGHAPTEKMASLQSYHMFLANEGRILQGAFNNLDKATPDALKPFGIVSYEGSKLQLFPDKSSAPVDYTSFVSQLDLEERLKVA